MRFLVDPAPNCMKGDMDDNTVLDGLDLQRFVDALLGSPSPQDICRGDYTENGLLEWDDTTGFVDALLGP
jgi:hypothetical protein